ncbi:protein of unknown function [Rhodovastum atsumiense]|nr:protein of unknown function [Rhodovastum atsumiense]
MRKAGRIRCSSMERSAPRARPEAPFQGFRKACAAPGGEAEDFKSLWHDRGMPISGSLVRTSDFNCRDCVNL